MAPNSNCINGTPQFVSPVSLIESTSFPIILLMNRMLAPKWAEFSGKWPQPHGGLTNGELLSGGWMGGVPPGAGTPSQMTFLLPLPCLQLRSPAITGSQAAVLWRLTSSFLSGSPVHKVLALCCGRNIYKYLVQAFSGR